LLGVDTTLFVPSVSGNSFQKPSRQARSDRGPTPDRTDERTLTS
jgi:hypothetical protein